MQRRQLVKAGLATGGSAFALSVAQQASSGRENSAAREPDCKPRSPRSFLAQWSTSSNFNLYDV